jgi:hypothetical protein
LYLLVAVETCLLLYICLYRGRCPATGLYVTTCLLKTSTGLQLLFGGCDVPLLKG